MPLRSISHDFDCSIASSNKGAVDMSISPETLTGLLFASTVNMDGCSIAFPSLAIRRWKEAKFKARSETANRRQRNHTSNTGKFSIRRGERSG
jgi:hypothetical protein